MRIPDVILYMCGYVPSHDQTSFNSSLEQNWKKPEHLLTANRPAYFQDINSQTRSNEVDGNQFGHKGPSQTRSSASKDGTALQHRMSRTPHHVKHSYGPQRAHPIAKRHTAFIFVNEPPTEANQLAHPDSASLSDKASEPCSAV